MVLKDNDTKLTDLRQDYQRLQASHKQAVASTSRVEELEALVKQLREEVETETNAKNVALTEKDNIKKEKDQVGLRFIWRGGMVEKE